MEDSPELLDTFMHAHICMSACTRSYFLQTKTRIHTRPRLKDFGPICTCMQANQGLFRDRKQRVTQGEMFVMEIWTAGVGKQS